MVAHLLEQIRGELLAPRNCSGRRAEEMVPGLLNEVIGVSKVGGTGEIDQESLVLGKQFGIGAASRTRSTPSS